MKVDRQDIQRHFRQMPDAELLMVHQSELTPIALRCYEEEIATRGLVPEPVSSVPDEQRSDTINALVSSIPDEQPFETARALAERIRREPEPQPIRRGGFQVAKEDVAIRYERMSNDEFGRLDPKDLTQDALACYIREASKRGLPLKPQKLPEPPQQPEEDEEVEKLLRDARFWSQRDRSHGPGVGLRMSPGTAHAVLSLIWVAVSLARENSEPAANRHPILWLRRFHSPRQDGAFKTLLSEACSGLATVVTLQDSTVSYSFDRGFGRFKWLMGGLVAVAAIANFFPFEEAVFVYLFVFLVMALVGLMVFICPDLGVIKISQRHPANHVAEIIQGIKKGENAGSHEPLVVSCDGQVWQTSVATAQALCDATIINVADFSANMEWELGTALRLTPRETIILVCGTEDGANENIPLGIAARIERVMGAGFIEKRGVFFFPLHVKKRAEGIKRPAEKLQRLLAQAIVRKRRSVGK